MRQQPPHALAESFTHCYSRHLLTAAVNNCLCCKRFRHAQETKAAAIACAAEKAIIATLGASNYKEVLRLSCEALASLCQAVTGRAAINAAGGINALIKVRT